jgi:hypothetical protein
MLIQGEQYVNEQIAQWNERAEIARTQGQDDVRAAALKVVSVYERLASDTTESDEPESLKEALVLRKRIESSEQHRTMCVEHGLSDAAIDATYEIQQLERDLVALLLRDA